MTTIDLLIERLQDRDISTQAKEVIVKELENMGVQVARCIYQPNLEGMLVSFEDGRNYVVSRETSKSVWLFDAKGIERRFTKDDMGGAAQTGMLNYSKRVLVAL